MKDLLSELETKGFCLLDNIFTNDELSDFKEKFTKCEEEVHRICEVSFTKLMTFDFNYFNQYFHKSNLYHLFV